MCMQSALTKEPGEDDRWNVIRGTSLEATVRKELCCTVVLYR
jgi:hypothetical protein